MCVWVFVSVAVCLCVLHIQFELATSSTWNKTHVLFAVVCFVVYVMSLFPYSHYPITYRRARYLFRLLPSVAIWKCIQLPLFAWKLISISRCWSFLYLFQCDLVFTFSSLFIFSSLQLIHCDCAAVVAVNSICEAFFSYFYFLRCSQFSIPVLNCWISTGNTNHGIHYMTRSATDQSKLNRAIVKFLALRAKFVCDDDVIERARKRDRWRKM